MQVFQPWIQKRKLALSKHKHVMSEILIQLKTNALGRLLTNDGDPNKVVIEKLVFIKLCILCQFHWDLFFQTISQAFTNSLVIQYMM